MENLNSFNSDQTLATNINETCATGIDSENIVVHRKKNEQRKPQNENFEYSTCLSFRKFRNLLFLQHFQKKEHELTSTSIPQVPGLYLGSYGAASNLEGLKLRNITHILCIHPSLPMEFHEEFKYLRIPILDHYTANLKSHFPIALEFIHNAIQNDERVLVHCFAGRSRSPAVICAYMIKYRKLKLQDALEYVQQARPQVKINPGFMLQLKEYENEIASE